MKGEDNSLLCCVVTVGLLLYNHIFLNLFFLKIWFNYVVTAVEEHESQVFQVECGEKSYEPAGEQHYYVLFK